METTESSLFAAFSLKSVIFASLIGISVLFLSKPVFFVILFISLDLLNSLIENTLKIDKSLIHPMEFFIFLASYKYGMFSGIILLFAYIFIRIFTFDFSLNKLKKSLFMVFNTIALANLNSFPFAFISIPLYLGRYLIEFVLFGKLEAATLIRIPLMIMLLLVFGPYILALM